MGTDEANELELTLALPCPLSSASPAGRTAPSSSKPPPAAPAAGWPPVHSSRRNLGSSSSKPSRLLKVHMAGIEIGRKIDVLAHSSYDELAAAVGHLFQRLLAAGNHSACAAAGLLDGSGEFCLVYEDEEGDRLLVGDDPWDTFVATAKRLRVLPSDLSAAVSRNRGR